MTWRPAGRVAGSVLAVVACGAGASSCASGGLPTGGAFTLSWRSTVTPRTAPIPFSGTIAGIAVRGSAANPVSLIEPFVNGGTLPPSLTIARWSGSFGSTSFMVSVSEEGGPVAGSLSQFSYVVTGTYGTQPVRATVDVGASSSSTLRLAGTIGAHHVRGTITIPNAHGTRRGSATGTFTLSG